MSLSVPLVPSALPNGRDPREESDERTENHKMKSFVLLRAGPASQPSCFGRVGGATARKRVLRGYSSKLPGTLDPFSSAII